MYLKKILVLAGVIALATGCSCRTRGMGAGDNLGLAEGGGPLSDVNFAFDSYALDATAKEKLTFNAGWLKENMDARVQVEGHCDERGTNEYNMALGARRAQASHDYLKSLGVDPSRMGTISYGEELPLDPGHNEDAWMKNRRAHFKVIK